MELAQRWDLDHLVRTAIFRRPTFSLEFALSILDESFAHRAWRWIRRKPLDLLYGYTLEVRGLTEDQLVKGLKHIPRAERMLYLSSACQHPAAGLKLMNLLTRHPDADDLLATLAMFTSSTEVLARIGKYASKKGNPVLAGHVRQNPLATKETVAGLTETGPGDETDASGHPILLYGQDPESFVTLMERREARIEVVDELVDLVFDDPRSALAGSLDVIKGLADADYLEARHWQSLTAASDHGIAIEFASHPNCHLMASSLADAVETAVSHTIHALQTGLGVFPASEQGIKTWFDVRDGPTSHSQFALRSDARRPLDRQARTETDHDTERACCPRQVHGQLSQ